VLPRSRNNRPGIRDGRDTSCDRGSWSDAAHAERAPRLAHEHVHARGDGRRQRDQCGSKVLTISPDGGKAAVSAPHKDAVLILDMVNGKMLRKIEVAGKPDGVAWAK
jgi:hypothetical protein